MTNYSSGELMFQLGGVQPLSVLYVRDGPLNLSELGFEPGRTMPETCRLGNGSILV